ncbi:hypothetical protein EsH8_IX_000989 [Colletotrichum jinshuiense]
MATYSKTLSGLTAQLSELAMSSSNDADKKIAAASIAQQILTTSKEPTPDWMDRMISVMELAALKLFLEWKAFEAIPQQGTILYTELAEKVEADEPLIRRLAWVLISGGILRQIDEDKVEHTEKSKSYLLGAPNEILFNMLFDEHVVTAMKLPAYFAQYGRREPVTRRHTPYAFAHGSPEREIWEILQDNPEQLMRAMKSMEMVQQFIPLAGIYDFGWVEAMIAEQHERPIFVDVGGGKGHAIKAILKENPFIPSERVILQDRDEVIEQVTTLKDPELQGVQLQVHDFHKAQPVTNALIYWIRRCLHDYGDDDSVMILSQLSDAMASDSKVLVVEYVLSNPPPPVGAMTDFSMLQIGGKERSEKDWGALLKRAGLKIEKIHGLDMKMQVIECVKA